MYMRVVTLEDGSSKAAAAWTSPTRTARLPSTRALLARPPAAERFVIDAFSASDEVAMVRYRLRLPSSRVTTRMYIHTGRAKRSAPALQITYGGAKHQKGGELGRGAGALAGAAPRSGTGSLLQQFRLCFKRSAFYVSLPLAVPLPRGVAAGGQGVTLS